MSVRPLLPSDEIAYRNFFYSLDEETVFLRFFHSVTIFSRKMAQDHWANMDYRNNISLIGVVQNKGNKEIATIATYAQMDEKYAEIAFVVGEDYQRQGIASYVLKELEKIAEANGFQGFFASILAKNTSMLELCKKNYPDIRIEDKGDEIEIWMQFTK